MHTLRAPGGRPWDREQTHETLVPSLLEEAYELAEAIHSGDLAHMEEELGDLLLQVVIHSEIASESEGFDLDTVAAGIADKLVRRHPHVFADSVAEDSEAVKKQWDEIKRAEKGDPERPFLADMPKALPALIRAAKIQKRVAKVGFDWPSADEVLAKIDEEVREVRAAIASRDAGEDAGDDLGEEIGDLLFAVVNLARKERFDAEQLLTKANEKFIRRFHAVEEKMKAEGVDLKDAGLERLDAAWDAVKEEESL